LLSAAFSSAADDYFKVPSNCEVECAAAALGIVGDAEKDVAPVVVFLANDDGHYVTGQTVMADGGRVML